MTVNFNKLYPWSDIETVTIDGQVMVKIPKFYIKVGKAPEGSVRAGKKCYMISGHKKDGYHIHPAFMRNGEVQPCFYIGAYEAYNAGSGKAGSASGKTPWVSMTNPQAIQYCNARNTGTGEQAGWHLQNIYERAAISLLMMIELGTPNVQTAIGAGNVSSSAAVATGGTNASWRGIHEFWGNVWEHCDGFKTDASCIGQIFDNKGNGTYKSTGVVVAGGWIKSCAEATGTDFDCNDVFIPSVSDSTEGNGTYSDYCWVSANCVYYASGDWDNGTQFGAFVFYVLNAASYSSTGIGLRLAKYPES